MKKMFYTLPTILCLLSVFASDASAVVLYWNNNGTSTPTNGTWDLVTSQWAADATPTATPVPWDPTAAAAFGVNAGTGNLSNLTITVNSAIGIAGIFNTGLNGSAPTTNLIFTGSGSFDLAAGVNAISVGNGSIGGGSGNNNIFYLPFTGVGSVDFQAATGSEYLAASNSYSGGTSISTGNGINFSTNNVFGSGTITVTPSLTQIVLATPNFLPASAGGAVFATNSPITIPNNVVASTTNALFKVILVGNASVPITFSGNWDLGTNAQTFDFRTTTVTMPGIISGSGPSLTKIGTSGILVLSGSNTYSGKTLINVGTISVNSINSVSGGSASSGLGHPTTVADGTINLGATTTAGTLIYTGTGETTDRILNLAGTTGGGVVQNDGTGALVFTSDLTVTGGGIKTFTLQGTNTDDNNRISGKIINGSSATAVTKAQAGTWTLAGANTFTGNLSISGGKLNIAHSSAMGTGTNIISGTAIIDNFAGADLTVANALTLSGGSLTYVGASNNMTYTGAATISGANRTITVSSNMLTLNSGIDDLAQGRAFTKAGAGTLRLLGANTYTGNTTINAGKLLLGSSATFATANNCTLAAGATLDASAIATFTVPGTNIFTASGSNTVEGVSAAIIKGGTTVSLGTRPITLTFRPTSFTGDTGHPSLIISQGALSLNGNAFTVNNSSGTSLKGGTYQLIQQSSGNITSSGVNTVSVTGNGIVPGGTAAIQVSGGDVNLVVTPPSAATISQPTLLTNGAVQLNFTGSAGGIYIIEVATNLNPVINWTALSTNTAATNGLFSYADTNATNFIERYYRARNQ